MGSPIPFKDLGTSSTHKKSPVINETHINCKSWLYSHTPCSALSTRPLAGAAKWNVLDEEQERHCNKGGWQQWWGRGCSEASCSEVWCATAALFYHWAWSHNRNTISQTWVSSAGELLLLLFFFFLFVCYFKQLLSPKMSFDEISPQYRHNGQHKA